MKSPVVGNHSFLSCLQVSAAALLKKYHSMRAEERGWRSGESARLPPLSLGIDSSVACGLTLLLVLVLAPRVLLWVLRFFISYFLSILTWKGGKEEPPSVMLTAKSYLCYDVS